MLLNTLQIDSLVINFLLKYKINIYRIIFKIYKIEKCLVFLKFLVFLTINVKNTLFIWLCYNVRNNLICKNLVFYLKS